jgi:hypothetical protein
MPFKSKAQRRKFAELLVESEISPETFEEWNRETGRANLPERVTREKSTNKKSARSKNRTATARSGSTKTRQGVRRANADAKRYSSLTPELPVQRKGNLATAPLDNLCRRIAPKMPCAAADAARCRSGRRWRNKLGLK